jgi:hypothetical protein
MGERISIQYTVDVDELPREIGRLLEDAFNQYQLLQTECRHKTNETTLSHATVERLDSIRLALAAIDHRLNDASNIISGYLTYKAHPEPGGNETPEDLEERLKQFQNSLETGKENEVSD